jgi:hypothetical protein
MRAWRSWRRWRTGARRCRQSHGGQIVAFASSGNDEVDDALRIRQGVKGKPTRNGD